MRQHTTWALAAAAAVTLAANGAWGQQTYALQHTNSIDLSSLFTSTSGYGNNPLSVAFDGTSAYVGGFNNGATASSAGVVKIDSVLGATPGLVGLAASQFASPNTRGIEGIAYDATNNRLVFSHQDNSVAASFIRAIHLDGTADTTFGTAGTVAAPGGVTPFAVAIDPTGDNGSPAIGFLSQSAGRRLALKMDGTLLYSPSGGPSPNGALTDSSPVSLGFTYRALAFDATGAMALSTQSGFAVGNRVGPNQFAGLGGTGNTTAVVRKSVSINNIGTGVALLEGDGPASLLVFAPRAAGTGSSSAVTLTYTDNSTESVQSGDIQIRNKDGSSTGITQTSLHGNEDGIGGAFSTELKNFAVGKDANGLPILISVSILDKRLDVYQMEPTYTADADGSWLEAGKWLAGVVPNAATLNAHFGPTTASRQITVDGGPVVKDLKLDSANGYTLVGGTLNVSAPAGQNGNVQVLQGTHSIQNPLSLAKTTVFNVAGGAGLSVTGGVTGAGGLSKIGVGAMTLGGTNAIAGALGITGGTLNVAGSVSGVTWINGAGTSGAPATINVTGTVALAANGTNAGTSKVSADTSLVIGATGRVDLNDNDAVMDYNGSSPINTVRGYLLNGRAGGAWNGAGGIVSSAAAASGGVTGIGYVEATSLGVTTFSGQSVGATSLLLKYTYAGDANLDGKVDGDDYTLIDKAWAAGVADAHWIDGDFNYDGVITSADYFLIDKSFGLQGGVLSPELLAERRAEFGEEYVSQLIAAVPEPTSLGLVGVAAAGLAGRRRRRD